MLYTDVTMTHDIKVKICGLKTREHVAVAAGAGASYVGFTFFAKSPRYIAPADAHELAQFVPDDVTKVALVVNPEDAYIDQLMGSVAIDMLQLHGQETPERVEEIRALSGLPIMKAVGVASEEDLAPLEAYEAVADQILLDAKAPKGSDRPGGNAVTFDWDLIAGRNWNAPWMLAGGLVPGNVAEAIARTGATQVDVSSGVESAPGDKDSALIRAFIAAAQSN